MERICASCQELFNPKGLGNYLCPECHTDVYTRTQNALTVQDTFAAEGLTVTPIAPWRPTESTPDISQYGETQ